MKISHLLKILFITLSAGFISPSVFAGPAQADLFSGRWKNDRGSEAEIRNNDGLLSGYYQTHAGQPDKSKKFPLTGFAQGDQITFTVNFKGYGSMTSWTGQLARDEKGPYIRTLWNLTRDVEDAREDDDLWKSITAGASVFRPIPKTAKPESR